MDIKEALEVISDGHSIITPEYAKGACEALGVELPTSLVTRWRSDNPATLKGLTMEKGHENSKGVYTLDLSYYVAATLGLGAPGKMFMGRGSQARANADAVAVKLEQPTD